uniref:persulfide dioxygenase ETHE1, mitochondrial-like n=1 Tax=Ciona intestinalis TaxID=7719 RepID=UPI000180C3B5|nr:persulfide dioxygenase ETHE1, mitochondrial-like [Ciona intestinalis]|eukprot:XP_002128021.1 persulfide dioxygenase ETHE1, mitochondrial-like [Ciona intestinalis]
MVKSNLIFRQLFDSDTSTYTYLLGCEKTKDAMIIEPVLECVERDLKLVNELGLNLIYGVNTHVHTDHTTGTGQIKKSIPNCKSVLGANSGGKADLYLKDGDNLLVGNLTVECRYTPGHTLGCFTFVLHEDRIAFTGDAVFVRGCGRTDLHHSCAKTLYHSVHSKIFSLPSDYKLYPAHDYKGMSVTTVGEEKLYNPRLTKTVDEFVQIMSNLKLDLPRRIDTSYPANLVCGIQD